MEDLSYSTLPMKNKHGEFLRKIYDYILEFAIFESVERKNPVINWKNPEELKSLLDLKLNQSPASETEIFSLIKDVIYFSVKIGHPYFINQLYSGLDPYGLVGQWITDALNPSIYTYEVAPVFTLMENEIINTVCSMIGWKNGDGIFCPGGSFANGIGINLSRFYFDNEIKKNGIFLKSRLAFFTSEDAHYSLHKWSALLGLGENNVILVKTDINGRMDINDLIFKIDQSRAAGRQPFLVAATAGTTVLGAIDPLRQLGFICSREKLWLHVDAAWGGGLLFSSSHKYKLDGIDSADSIVWNPHKMMAVPQQCSLFLTRHENLLLACHSQGAEYLFQPDKFYNSARYDLGDKHLQCGRRADVLKFWLMWKAKGSSGFEKHVDTLIERALYLRNNIKKMPNFKLVMEPEFINVCFWYIPESLRGNENNNHYHELLHKIAPRIKELMVLKGSLMIGYQPLRKLPNFFRFVLQNSGFTNEDVDYVLNEIDKLGHLL